MLRLSKKRLITFWTISTLSYVLYAEFFIYKLNTNNWLSISCKNNHACTKILLVADPQIIGNLNENFHLITPLSIYDSDRYLKITYSHVYDFVKPDVVIFLGDLMDEAHMATDEDFNQYVRRLFNIFLSPYSESQYLKDQISTDEDFNQYVRRLFNILLSPYSESQYVKHIWLPGDNDIGGEDTRVTPKKLQRFERAFYQPSLNLVKNITFFKINRLTLIIPVYKKERDFYDTNKIFVGLSHVPLMFRPSPFSEKVINKMFPHVLFTAHEHKSMIISTDALLHQDYHIIPVNPDNVQIYEYTLGVTDMYEIMIPTCSYRMGTKKIGYGSAIIENNELKFTILWSPSRFEQLYVYIVLILLPLSILCIFKSYGCARNILNSNVRNLSMIKVL